MPSPLNIKKKIKGTGRHYAPVYNGWGSRVHLDHPAAIDLVRVIPRPWQYLGSEEVTAYYDRYWAWERAAEKVTLQSGLDYTRWNGKQFAAATEIYKRTLAKYGGHQPGPTTKFEMVTAVPAPARVDTPLARIERALECLLEEA